jgi:L-amino acid N-acyltransferase YncA
MKKSNRLWNLIPISPRQTSHAQHCRGRLFIDEKYQGKGYGKILLQYIINDCERVKIKALIAVLLDINKRSIRLLKKFAFKKWGHFPEVIEFEDKTCGQLIYGKKITEDDYVDLIFL